MGLGPAHEGPEQVRHVGGIYNAGCSGAREQTQTPGIWLSTLDHPLSSVSLFTKWNREQDYVPGSWEDRWPSLHFKILAHPALWMAHTVI